MKTITVQFEDLENWSVASFLFGKNIFINFELVELNEVLTQYKDVEILEKDKEYNLCGIHSYGKELFHREKKLGSEIKSEKLFKIKKGTFIYSRLSAHNGGFDLVGNDFDNYYVTNEFPVFEINTEKILPDFLRVIFSLEILWKKIDSMLQGAAHKRFRENKLLSLEIPLPDLKTQKKIVEDFYSVKNKAEEMQRDAEKKEREIDEFLMSELGIEKVEHKKKKGAFVVMFEDLERWSVKFNLWSKNSQSNKFETINFDKKPNLIDIVQRGRSPKYSDDGKNFILNQKCNRWNEIDISYAKKVENSWLENINSALFLRKDDIIINSTGEGTIGRSSLIKEDGEGLFYDSHMLLLRLNQEIINPLFFMFIFNSNYGQGQIELIKSAQSTNQTELGVDNLSKINFPLPSIEIQKTIVEKIEKIRSEIETLKNQSTQLLQTAKTNLEKQIVGV